MGLLRDAQLFEIKPDDEIAFKHLKLSFFRTTHSIPEPIAMVVDTPQGKIVATGDFKFDFTPVGDPADLHRMAALGTEGVFYYYFLTLRIAEIPTFSHSEKVVGASIQNI